jgi:hypothetical protein
VGSTNRAGSVATALEMLRELVESTSRRLQEHLAPFLERLHALARGRSAVSQLPAPANSTAGPPGGGSEDARPPAAVDGELPRAYGQSRAVLMARDPWWLFAHWEVPPVRRVEVLRALGVEGEGTREVLRVYEVAADSSASWDIDLPPGAERTDIHVDRPGRSYRVEIGLRTAAGRFVCLVTSNLVAAPPAEPSRDTAVHWVTVAEGRRAISAAGDWSGRRVPAATTATALVPAGAAAPDSTPAPRSSEGLPAGPRASDALPLR